MADSKITALASIGTGTDPANDPLVIVDVSDILPGGMSLTGTTKKVTLNNLLACSPTATLASATITGDLTVDTSTLKVDSANNRVIVGHTSGSSAFQVTNAGAAGIEIQPTGFSSAPLILSYNRSAPAYTQLTLDGSTIVHALSGSTAMTLNSTGLGIGTTTPTNKLEVVAPAGDNIVSTFRSGDATAANNAGGGFRSISSATAANRVAQVWLDADGANFSGGDYFFIQKNGGSGTVEFNQSSNAAMVFLTNSTEQMRLNSTGLGVGRSPSYRLQASSGTKATTASLATVAGITTTDADDFGIYFRLKTDATGANRYAAISSFDNGSGNGARDLVLQDLGGNVGIGVVPSAWTAYKALQINTLSSLSASSGSTDIALNWRFDSSNKYIANGFASSYTQYNGSHIFNIAGNNTLGAGAALTWTPAMTLDASGRLITNSSTFTPPTLNTNGDLNFIATSNTNVRFSYRGTDGVTRVANITLA